ncbi:MAG: hypothetical protein AB1656_02730 [Candidatus Omnitrophota bacterium]
MKPPDRMRLRLPGERIPGGRSCEKNTNRRHFPGIEPLANYPPAIAAPYQG